MGAEGSNGCDCNLLPSPQTRDWIRFVESTPRIEPYLSASYTMRRYESTDWWYN